MFEVTHEIFKACWSQKWLFLRPEKINKFENIFIHLASP